MILIHDSFLLDGRVNVLIQVVILLGARDSIGFCLGKLLQSLLSYDLLMGTRLIRVIPINLDRYLHIPLIPSRIILPLKVLGEKQEFYIHPKELDRIV